MGILLCTIACQKETTADSVEPTIDSIWTAAPKLEPEPLPPGDEMILGDPIDSPHTVENMKKALNSLRKSFRAELPGDYEVKTTHYYVKFLPENEAHLDSLSLDEELILYGYPLDRKIKKLGNYYIDPNAPKDKPMPLYASVEVDDELPQSVPYEILSNLHIPNEYGDYEFIESNQRRLSNFAESFIDESLRLTNHWEEVVTPAKNARSGKWTPWGTIKTYDSSEGSNIPVEGIKVRARRWFTTLLALRILVVIIDAMVPSDVQRIIHSISNDMILRCVLARLYLILQESMVLKEIGLGITLLRQAQERRILQPYSELPIIITIKIYKVSIDHHKIAFGERKSKFELLLVKVRKELGVILILLDIFSEYLGQLISMIQQGKACIFMAR